MEMGARRLALRLVSFCLLYSCFARSCAGKAPSGMDFRRYMLSNGEKDSCMTSHATMKGQAECLQGFLESYYGRYFTMYCPHFPYYLAEYECEGCPWDRTNPSMVNSTFVEEYDASRTVLFHKAAKTCTVANRIKIYSSYEPVNHRVVVYGVSGALLILFATTFLTLTAKTKVFGYQFSNAVIFLFSWVVFDIGYLLLVASEDYFRLCETVSGWMLLEIFDEVSYATIAIISFWKCLHLEVDNRDVEVKPTGVSFQSSPPPQQMMPIEVYPHYNPLPHGSHGGGGGIASWVPASELSQVEVAAMTNSGLQMMLLRGSAMESWAKFAVNGSMKVKNWRTLLGKVLYFGAPLTFITVYILEGVGTWKPGDYVTDSSLCLYGLRDVVYGGTQYSKLVLEVFAVAVYAMGPPKNRTLFFVRYVLLALIPVFCGMLLGITLDKSMYRPYSVSMTITGVADFHISGHFVEITHAFLLALLGLLEPLRIGWPKSSFYKD